MESSVQYILSSDNTATGGCLIYTYQESVELPSSSLGLLDSSNLVMLIRTVWPLFRTPNLLQRTLNRLNITLISIESLSKA